MISRSRVKRVLHAAGHYAHKLRRQSFPGVAVLCYHAVRDDRLPPGSLPFEDLHVRAGELDAHARLLSATCHPITLAQWRSALAGGPPLPARPVLMTFDDGYRSYQTAAEILGRHGVPSVLFACSGPVEKQAALWFDAVARAFGKTGEGGEAEVERLKEVPYPAWRERTAAFENAVPLDAPEALLSPGELRTVAARPLCEIGGHTVRHPILARASREEQRAEIADNRDRLQEWTGRPVTAFAYPNGQPGQDYTAETVELVRQAGYDFAFTTHDGFAVPGESPLERSRFVMTADISAAELAHRLCYSWQP